jgi:glycogen debranching enzyme
VSTVSQQLVLKEDRIFLVSQENGDVQGSRHSQGTGDVGLGLYFEDTRYLSLFTFKVNGQVPSLLNVSGYRNFMAVIQYANEIMQMPNGELVLPQTISIRRSRFIGDGLHERIGLVNYNRFPIPITVELTFGADFRDIFDVRGFPRSEWGELLAPQWQEGVLTLGYKGLDGVPRSTAVTFERAPDNVAVSIPEVTVPAIEPGIMVPAVGAPSRQITIQPPFATATWSFVLEPDIPQTLTLHLMPHSGTAQSPKHLLGSANSSLLTTDDRPLTTAQGRFDQAVDRMRASYRDWDAEGTTFSTDNEELNALWKRGKYDLRLLCQPLRVPGPSHGEDAYFPSAGVPWYVCPFGRDSIITALQTLSLNPKIAIGTLRELARYQGTKVDPWREEQPGKILHEFRTGEMARLGMVPHSPYYGTTDATPLYVMLFVEAMRWLDDDRLYEEFLPNVWRAVDWIDNYGDLDGDGFVEYGPSNSEHGIRNQVWKDSSDSMQFPDGTLAEPPIAAVEVQGYVYAAKVGLAQLLRHKGEAKTADKLDVQAQTLKEHFNQAFWMSGAGCFAQGLDKDKRQVPTITSNPGHALWCGIAHDDKARLTVERMVQSDMLSGWGVRTISDKSPSYNPMSYHNGSIWPHDNSIVADGFKQYNCHTETNRLIAEIVEASQHFQYARLPELYCGFTRDRVYASGPAEYPVSCSPQAWAAGAPFLMLEAMLGLRANAHNKQVHISPHLPDWLTTIRVSNMRVGDKRISFRVDKHGGRTEAAPEGEYAGISLEIA